MEKTMADTIRYAAGQSSLGPFVAAQSERGLAMVEFGEMHEADLRGRFLGADLVKDPAALQATLVRLGELIEHPERW
jgi:AraC family transcriptional regulator, regulatory protein of adaptative response / methylated-DNA-[protein]-cysteine methyltransferase